MIFDDTQDDEIIIRGNVYCPRGVILEVEKRMDVRHSRGHRRVRTFSYRYAAWVENLGPVLRYHNLHGDLDEYHHRILDPRTGETVFHETLERRQFPTFTEVLDELEVLTRPLAP